MPDISNLQIQTLDSFTLDSILFIIIKWVNVVLGLVVKMPWESLFYSYYYFIVEVALGVEQSYSEALSLSFGMFWHDAADVDIIYLVYLKC